MYIKWPVCERITIVAKTVCIHMTRIQQQIYTVLHPSTAAALIQLKAHLCTDAKTIQQQHSGVSIRIKK